MVVFFFFFQAEDGIRDLVRSRGLGDVYKRQVVYISFHVCTDLINPAVADDIQGFHVIINEAQAYSCLLYTSDAADERSSVDLGGRRIINKKKKKIASAHQ